jgi:hypothetical protein
MSPIGKHSNETPDQPRNTQAPSYIFYMIENTHSHLLSSPPEHSQLQSQSQSISNVAESEANNSDDAMRLFQEHLERYPDDAQWTTSMIAGLVSSETDRVLRIFDE